MSEWAPFTQSPDWFVWQDPTLDVDIDDAVWSFDPEDDGGFEQWSKATFVPGAGYAARRGDVMLHGDPIAPGLGSPDVCIGGRPALRSCDSHVCTKTTPEPHAGTGFVATCGTVEINGFPALRVGDYVDEGPHGLDPIVTGCPSVQIGPTPRPVECWRPGEPLPRRRRTGRHPFRWHCRAPGRAGGKIVLGGELAEPRMRVDATVEAAQLWAEGRLPLSLHLGDLAPRRTAPGKSIRVLQGFAPELDARPVTRTTSESTSAHGPTRAPVVVLEHEIVEQQS